MALFRFFLLIPFAWLAGKWGREGHWCTHHTLSLIATFEGFSSKTYLCPAGVPTVGYGHVLEDGETFSDIHLTQDQAMKLLRKDLISANDICPYLADPDSLESHQMDALASLTYNLGHIEIGQSWLVQYINENKIEDAYDFFAPWRNVNGKIYPGLAKRRLAELMVFANRPFDPNSDLLPSEQWGMPLKYTDENWTLLKDVDKANGWGFLRDAVRIFYEYKASKNTVKQSVNLIDEF